ncbi:MAG: S8 family serine peptidase [Thermoanaerobaculia bacterium]
MNRRTLLTALCALAVPAAALAQPLASYEKVLHRTTAKLPYTGHTVELAKAYDPILDSVREIALEGGLPVDFSRLAASEQKAQREALGNLHPALARKLATGTDATFKVLIRFAIDEPAPDKTKARTQADRANLARAGAAIEERLASRASALFAARLAQLGDPRARQLVVSGPFVAAELSRDSVLALARDKEIALIGPIGEEVYDFPTIQQSLPTTRTNEVNTAGFNGAGVLIAVMENGDLEKPAACFNIAATQVTAGFTNHHMTNSPGIIGNRFNPATGGCNGTLTGYATGASVLMANDSLYPSRYDWARSQGVNVVTMSWHETPEETSGMISTRDIYFDYWTTRPPFPLVFTSAGNQAGSGAFASGKGFNIVGVGNVTNDGDGNRCNDTMDSTSSFIDPTSTHGDREVPAIASPGSRHALMDTDFGGTSCATPVTAAIAADILSSNTVLKGWPEGMRAILLATATYQGADGANYSRTADGKDGAGMTNSWYAYHTAKVHETGTTPQLRAHDYGLLSNASFSGGYLTKTWTIKANGGTRVRAALVWNSNVTADADGNPQSSTLDLDLDLQVYDSNGFLVASSSTFDNSWELIEFTPPASGNYTIKVRGYSIPANLSRYFGIAWSQHYPNLGEC